ncbi:hypothetical protein [Staphylococcus simiae]|nr:hypothetical protein [Staphylococcus simiae]
MSKRHEGIEGLDAEKAFEADEIRNERHDFRRAKGVRERRQ